MSYANSDEAFSLSRHEISSRLSFINHFILPDYLISLFVKLKQ